MKALLMKIGLIAATIWSTHCIGLMPSLLPFPKTISHVAPSAVPKKKKIFSQYLALETNENLKAYHLGLQTISKRHLIPNFAVLLETILSHSHFCGVMTTEQGIELFHQSALPFLIFQDQKSGSQPHFYIAHPRGLRHFTINTLGIGNDAMASLDNGVTHRYPSLNHFINSTLS